MSYKYGLYEKHEIRMVEHVKRDSAYIAKCKFEKFIMRCPIEMSCLKSFYECVRNDIIEVLDREEHERYFELERSYRTKNCVIVFASFLRNVAAGSDFNNDTDFFCYWDRKLSEELSHFQYLELIDEWYANKLRDKEELKFKIEEEQVVLKKDMNNYNELSPSFNIEDLSCLFCNKDEFAYLFLNLLYDGKCIDKCCRWTSSVKSYGSILGILHAYREKDILPPKIDVQKKVLYPIRELLDAGCGKLNTESKNYRTFYNKTIDRLNERRSIKLNIVS